jgi:hypothetical protein
MTRSYGVSVCICSPLQEDKEPLFDSVETVIGILEVTAEFADNISFNPDRLAKSLPAGHLDATTLADYLVKKVGSPFATSSDRTRLLNLHWKRAVVNESFVAESGVSKSFASRKPQTSRGGGGVYMF